MATVQELLRQCEAQTAETVGSIAAYRDQIAATHKTIDGIDETIRNNTMKLAILKEASSSVKQMSADMLAQLCTQSVQRILGDEMSVRVRHGQRNGVATMEFELVSKYNGYETVLKPTDDESGGGVSDIVSMAIFLTLNLLNSENNSAPILLDEPTKFVSKGNAAKVADFLRDFSQDCGKQILMVTHAQETVPYADAVFHVALDSNGVSAVS